MLPQSTRLRSAPILTDTSTKASNHVVRVERGLLDTSVVIDLHKFEPADLPAQVAISSITMAELVAGPHAVRSAAARAERIDRIQRAEAMFDPLPFDIDAARAYGRIYAATVEAGQKPRGQRAVDLLIAATALSNGLPLVTRNREDFKSLAGLVEVVAG